MLFRSLNCQNSIQNSNITIKDSVAKVSDAKQFFPEHFFKIDCPCKLNKVLVVNQKTPYYSYSCMSILKKTKYSILVKDISNILIDDYAGPLKMKIRKDLMDIQEKNLKNLKINYQKINFYGHNSLEYSFIKDSSNSKEIMFMNNNFWYTLNVTSKNENIDSVFKSFVNSFELYFKSAKYSYTIEIPKGFYIMPLYGKNSDFHYVNERGNSIVIVVKKLMPEEVNATADDLLAIPNEEWEKNLEGPKLKVDRKGKVTVDNHVGMFLYYNDIGVETPLYYTTYSFIDNGYYYNLLGTCKLNQVDEMRLIFFRTFQSLKFAD